MLLSCLDANQDQAHPFVRIIDHNGGNTISNSQFDGVAIDVRATGAFWLGPATCRKHWLPTGRCITNSASDMHVNDLDFWILA